MNDNTILEDVEKSEKFHWLKVSQYKAGQLVTMILVGLSGALTTFSGTTASEGTFARQPGVILLVGIVATLGAIITQIYNFSERISKNRAAALGHKTIALGLKSGKFSDSEAITLEAKVFKNPEAALEALAEKQS